MGTKEVKNADGDRQRYRQGRPGATSTETEYRGARRRRSGGGPGGGCARMPVGIPSPPRGGRRKPRSRSMLNTIGG
jgi:hypothetical protein